MCCGSSASGRPQLRTISALRCFARLAPPNPFLPPEHYGKPIVGMLLVWAGDPASGQKAIAPLRAIATPIADVVRPVPYLFLQGIFDGGAPHGIHYYWKSHRLPRLTDEVIDAVVQRVESITSPLSQISGWAVGGAVSRVPRDATAVGEREVGFELNIIAAWPPVDPEPLRHKTWVRDGWEALKPHSVGVYTNFLSDEDAAFVRSAYGERLARLTALKDRYDPGNFFSMNANIAPSAAGAAPKSIR